MPSHPYPAWFTWSVTAFIALHGLVHLIGPASAFGWIPPKDTALDVSTVAGAIWLVTALIFLATSVAYGAGSSHWWIPATVGVVASQALIISQWQSAWFGTIPNILFALACAISFGSWQFTNSVEQDLSEFRPEAPKQQTPIRSSDLEDLPTPVQKWLTSANILDKPPANEIQLHQTGRMRTEQGGRWMSVSADQYIRIDNPGYIWIASVRAAPLTFLSGRDKFVDGKGHMLIKLLSLIPVANARGETIDQGSLVRFLAEIVWAPSAALASYIDWNSVDSDTARATMSYGNMTASATFEFTPEGRVTQISADRFYDRPDGSTKQRWTVDISSDSYRTFDGVQVPTRASVTWQLDEPFTWYELSVTQLTRR